MAALNDGVAVLFLLQWFQGFFNGNEEKRD
jgi:hypothetical protein